MLLGIPHESVTNPNPGEPFFFLTTSFINLLPLNNGSYVLIPTVMPDSSTWGEWWDLNLYTGLPLFPKKASSQNLDSHGSLGKRSYVANLLFSSNLRALLESRSESQLGQFLSPMDGRGIASETISYKPLLIWDQSDGEEFFLRPITSSCGSATDTGAGDREKEQGRSIQSY